ncbi:MAG: hypothetical protein V3T49_04630 [Dehalococcoidia bacterium]
MGIRSIFANSQTRNAFLLTFLVPLIGGYLYAKHFKRALVVTVIAVIGVPFYVAISVVFAVVLATAACGAETIFSDCTAGRNLIAQIVAFAILGVMLSSPFVAAALDAANCIPKQPTPGLRHQA